jgi:phosphotransferase system enzyme I (PtsP)
VEGIGLYRTEFTFMTRDSFPSEEEQLAIYRQVLACAAPRPVTMRTLDAGGDKPLPYFQHHEGNPYLGWRGIRMSLDHPEIFLSQVRAMLRANAEHRNLRIMFPMIASIDELREAQSLLARACVELGEERRQFAPAPTGIMVEVPAAVYQARLLATEADFLSLGTNDLVQYMLAVDRDNARVANRFDALHPAVVQAVADVVTRGHEAGKPVGICGEMAGEPEAAVLLLGAGIDEISTGVTRLPMIKAVIRAFDRSEARAVLERALAQPNAAGVRSVACAALEAKGFARFLAQAR